jgi:hypothetical protein
MALRIEGGRVSFDKTVTLPRFMVIGIGCLECGVESSIEGFYATREEAEASLGEGYDSQYVRSVIDLQEIPDYF